LNKEISEAVDFYNGSGKRGLSLGKVGDIKDVHGSHGVDHESKDVD